MIHPLYRDAAGSLTRRLTRRLTVLAAILTPALVQGQAPSRGDLLVLLSGNDTISIERVQRGPAALDGELLLKAANARFTYRVEIDPQGGATRLQNAYRPAAADAASEPLQRANVSFTGDSAIAELSGGGRTTTQRFATRQGALPFLNPSFALLELVVHQARLRGGDSVSVPVWMIQGGQTAMAAVVRRGGDSMVVTMGNIPVHLRGTANSRVHTYEPTSWGRSFRGSVAPCGDADQRNDGETMWWIGASWSVLRTVRMCVRALLLGEVASFPIASRTFALSFWREEFVVSTGGTHVSITQESNDGR